MTHGKFEASAYFSGCKLSNNSCPLLAAFSSPTSLAHLWSARAIPFTATLRGQDQFQSVKDLSITSAIC